MAAVDATMSEAQWAGLWGEMNATSMPYVVASTATDAGHTNFTSTLRAGLIMGLDANGELVATNGYVTPAIGILPAPVDMLVSGVATDRDVSVLTSGQIRKSECPNINFLNAQQLVQRGFRFDKPEYNLTGQPSVLKIITADTVLLAADCGTLLMQGGNAGDNVTVPDPVAGNLGLYYWFLHNETAGSSSALTIDTATGGTANAFVIPDGTNAGASIVVGTAVVGMFKLQVLDTGDGTTPDYNWVVVGGYAG
jgi:hypothetical protein